MLMIFLPKCRPFHIVLDKEHGTGKKGMALEKRGMAWRHAKTGKGKLSKTVKDIIRHSDRKNLKEVGLKKEISPSLRA